MTDNPTPASEDETWASGRPTPALTPVSGAVVQPANHDAIADRARNRRHSFALPPETSTAPASRMAATPGHGEDLTPTHDHDAIASAAIARRDGNF